jgi:RNA polymerase sigma-54 factor
VTSLEHGLGQTQTVTPAVIQGVQLLALPSWELVQQVHDALSTNPALDEETGHCPYCGTRARDAPCRCSARPPVSTAPGRTVDPDVPDRSSGDVPDLLAAAATLLPAGDRPLLEYVVADLDGRGFLDRPIGRLAADLGVAEERVRAVVGALRQVGPAGLCAADLVDCLLLQLDAAANAPGVLRPMIERHLPALCRGRTTGVARDLGVPVTEVNVAWDYLRTHLRPHADLDRGGEAPSPVRPDLVMQLDDGQPVVALTTQPRLRLHPDFVALAADRGRLTTLTPTERAMVTRSIAEAAAFLDRLAQRGRTLLLVGVEVARRQQEFLRAGPSALQPLTRAEVAAALGLHESTVSRAVAGKWVQVPTGSVVPLADLFGTTRSAQECLRALVAAERTPLSDAELVSGLATHGHCLSRSAVRKYRQRFGIPPQRLR